MPDMSEQTAKSECCALEEEHRHLGLLEISEGLLNLMFRVTPPGRWYRTTEGLPQDARLCGAQYDAVRRVYQLLYESNAFPAVGAGDRLTHVVRVIHETCQEDEPPCRETSETYIPVEMHHFA